MLESSEMSLYAGLLTFSTVDIGGDFRFFLHLVALEFDLDWKKFGSTDDSFDNPSLSIASVLCAKRIIHNYFKLHQ